MATTTTNFNFPIPQSTDLVKDGATAIAALGTSVDTQFVDLKGGTTGQILSKASNTDLDYTWTSPNPGDITGVTASSPLTGGGTSGDVTVGILDATTSNKGAVQLSTSTSSTSTSLAATASAVKTAFDLANEGGPAFRAYRTSSVQTFAQNTWTKVQFNAESYDTGTCFDSTTNYRFTPTKAGYYQLNAFPTIQRGGTGILYCSIYKNGAEAATNAYNAPIDTFTPMSSDLIYLNGSTDYAEVYVYDQSGVYRQVANSSGMASYFSGTWIRS